LNHIETLREFRAWRKDAPRSATKKLERLRSFFNFAIENDWIAKNAAKLLKRPLVKDTPTLPYDGEQMERILEHAGDYDELGYTFVLTMRPEPEATSEGKPETFTFLGASPITVASVGRRCFTVWWKTAKKRMVAKLPALKTELRRQRHQPLSLVGAWLRQAVLGYYPYHAVPGNLHRLFTFGYWLRRLWRAILIRRSQRGRMSGVQLTPLMNPWIPPPRVLHPYPLERFTASHPR
jgi:hypothetical protein